MIGDQRYKESFGHPFPSQLSYNISQKLEHWLANLVALVEQCHQQGVLCLDDALADLIFGFLNIERDSWFPPASPAAAAPEEGALKLHVVS